MRNFAFRWAAGASGLTLCAAGSAGVLAAVAVAGPAAQAGMLLALGWLAGFGCVLPALARHRVAAEDRAARLEAQLCVERQARARAERALAGSHGVLRKVVRKQSGVRDAERARIARDIHDDLGQSLLALRIELALLQVQAKGMHPAWETKLGLLLATLDGAIRALRGVIHGLRPLALDEGLAGAMERQLHEFSRITGVRHQLVAARSACEQAARAAGREALLYRVLQEALSNVARHAQASRVRVTLGCEGEQLVLRIEDDGIGMAAGADGRGCGLAGMRERAGAERGTLSIVSEAGAGTRLALSIPLAPRIAA